VPAACSLVRCNTEEAAGPVVVTVRRERSVRLLRDVLPDMTYASVNGLRLYYEVHGSERPLVLLHGGLLTIELNWGELLAPLAAGRQVIAVELQEHGHTGAADRPMTMDALAGDVIGLLDQLGVAEADLFGFSLGGLVSYAVAFAAPDRVGKLIVASADPLRPPGRESAPTSEDRMPTRADFLAMQAAYTATAPEPALFEKSAAKTSALVHEFPGWTRDQLRSLRTPALLIFGDRDFSPLRDVLDTFELLPDAQLAVLPDTTHMGVTQQPDRLLSLITPFLNSSGR
jgi:pimeloyl-ACP methyl ester carboxylesterase